MSTWTSVAAVARILSFRVNDYFEYESKADELADHFGKEVHFSSPEEVWKDYLRHRDKYMPTGSEGSLARIVYENPDHSHMEAYTVTIFGNLRDYSTPSDIVEWFKSKLRNMPNDWMVSQAMITAETDFGETVSYVLTEEDKALS